jgi:adenylate cyclase class 2
MQAMRYKIMKQLETEIKFYLIDLPPTRQRILDLGAASQGRFFESNVRFEDARLTLKKKKSLLRLRRDRRVKLTYKSTPAEPDRQFKVMRELEVEVSDFDTMQSILESLGYHREQTYEKWRETLVLDHTQFCLDSMPYGHFLEIEGPKSSIKKFAAQLGLPWDRRILLNYLQIFEILKNNLSLDFSDLTFENFKNVEVDLMDYLDLLIAGD